MKAAPKLARLVFCAGMIATLFAAVLINAPKPARACTVCSCVFAYHGSTGTPCTTRHLIAQEHEATGEHIAKEFDDWEWFLIEVVWDEYLHPAFMFMTEQVTAVAMHQMLILGTFFDAKHQMEVERAVAERFLEAHRDYHPDIGICVFGTNIRSLASAERDAELTSYILSKRSLDRQMGNMLTAGARGGYSDRNSRMRLFRDRFCAPGDHHGELRYICRGDVNPETVNKDIDVARTIARSNTLRIDFTDNAARTDDEIDILALADNLYSHELMFRPSPAAFRPRHNQGALLDMRSVIAKRSVAEHAFNSFVGMRTPNPSAEEAETTGYMRIIFEQMGVEDDEIAVMLDEHPSYYAQMEILTKRLYNNQHFFVDLYQKPANTERKKVAMQAIGLMQDFDIWDSYLRMEAMLSVILELEIIRLHQNVQNRISRMR